MGRHLRGLFVLTGGPHRGRLLLRAHHDRRGATFRSAARPRPRGTAVPTRRGMGEAGFRPGPHTPTALRNVLGQHTRRVGSVIVLWRELRLGSSSGK